MSEFLKKLSESRDRCPDKGFMCHYECFMGDFDKEWLPFDNHIQYHFPTLNIISKEMAKALGELSQIPEPTENHYQAKIVQVLNLPLSRDLFKEDSLSILKEHCKLFSPYNEKTKELLKKLDELEPVNSMTDNVHDLEDFIKDCKDFDKELESIEKDGKPFFDEYWK